MSILSKNLVFLRKYNNDSQAGISNGLDVPTSTYANWEYGKSEPSVEHILDICELFVVTPTQLLTEELKIHPLDARPKPNIGLSKNSSFPDVNPEPQPELNPQKANKTASPKASLNTIEEAFKAPHLPSVITIDHTGNENIIYVPVAAQAGYLNGYSDPGFIESLPAFSMPGLRNGTFRMFEVQGQSMYPTLSGTDKVIARHVPSLSEVNENQVHIVIHQSGILVKRLQNRLSESGKITLHSDHINYPDMELNPSEIKEIWYVVLRITAQLQEPSEIYTRIAKCEVQIEQILKKQAKK